MIQPSGLEPYAEATALMIDLGLDADAAQLYLALLEGSPGAPTMVATQGVPAQPDPAVAALADLGLVTAGADGHYHPLPPDLVFDLLAVRQEQRLREIRELVATMVATIGPRQPARLAEVPPGTASIAAYLDSLLETARTQISLWIPDGHSPTFPALLRLRPRPSGVDVRVAFQADRLKAEELEQLQRAVSRVSGVARPRTSLTVPLALADQTAAVVGPASDSPAVLVRGRTVVGMVAATFDAKWRGDKPTSAAGGAAHGAIAAMLIDGFKDDTVARALHVSPRSARRRIGEYFGEIGASTRFQAGYLVGCQHRERAPKP